MRFDNLTKERCRWACSIGDNLMTRCMKVPGHSGPHVGKGLKKFPYQRIEWFPGDRREFLSEASSEYAWSSRKKGSGQTVW